MLLFISYEASRSSVWEILTEVVSADVDTNKVKIPPYRLTKLG